LAVFIGPSARGEPLSTGKELQEGRVLHSQDVGSFPVNMIVSPDGQFAITTDIGYRQAIWAISLSDGVGQGHVAFPNKDAAKEAIRLFDKIEGAAKQTFSDSGEEGESPELPKKRSLKSYGLYYGLAITADRTIYAAQGGNDTIALLTLAADGSLTPKSRIKTKPDDFPAGVCLDDHGHLYVTNQRAGGKNPYTASGSVAVYDTSKGEEIGRWNE
jgi:DNA-binding beta-propeller fold protein YncE